MRRYARRVRGRAPLRVPAVLAIAVLGCDGETLRSDADPGQRILYGDGNCGTVCFPSGGDAGLCPDPLVCTSAVDRTCPAGCFCTAYCIPITAQGEMNCPRPDGGGFPECAFPDLTCPEGCAPAT
jgi:hypothetical protein